MKNEMSKQEIPMKSMELPVFIGGKEYSAFLQPVFFDAGKMASVFHDHGNAEIHLVIKGKLEYRVGNETYVLYRDQIMLIPQGVFHGPLGYDGETRHIAFQVQLGECGFRIVDMPDGTLERVYETVQKSVETNCGNRLSSTLAYICSELIDDGDGCGLQPLRKREVVIREYISRHYAEDRTVDDLADELGLSVKQTEREVYKIFGMPFGKTICERRMSVAEQLISSGKYTLSDVSLLVGYKTYSGFWKAHGKYSQKNEK